MKNVKWVFFVFCMAAMPALSPADSGSPSGREALEISLEELKADLGGVYRSLGDLVEQKEAELEKKLETCRDKLDKQVDELQEKVKKMSGPAMDNTDRYIQELKAKSKEMTENAKTALGRAKADFSGHLEKNLSDLEQKIDQLRGSVQGMSDEARQKLARQLAVLQKKNKKIRERLTELSSKGIASWREVKKSLLDIWQDLKDAYNNSLDDALFHKV